MLAIAWMLLVSCPSCSPTVNTPATHSRTFFNLSRSCRPNSHSFYLSRHYIPDPAVPYLATCPCRSVDHVSDSAVLSWDVTRQRTVPRQDERASESKREGGMEGWREAGRERGSKRAVDCRGKLGTYSTYRRMRFGFTCLSVISVSAGGADASSERAEFKGLNLK